MEYWSVGVKENWSDGVKRIGVMEYWSVGVMGRIKDRCLAQYSTTPLLQYSN